MNKIQKWMLIIAAVVITLMMLVPPSISRGRRGVSYFYTLIGSAEINALALFLQILVVLVVTGLLCLAFRDKK